MSNHPTIGAMSIQSGRKLSFRKSVGSSFYLWYVSGGNTKPYKTIVTLSPHNLRKGVVAGTLCLFFDVIFYSKTRRMINMERKRAPATGASTQLPRNTQRQRKRRSTQNSSDYLDSLQKHNYVDQLVGNPLM